MSRSTPSTIVMVQDNPPPPTRRPKHPPENKKSILLSEEENRTVFELLGKGRQTLSTAVAQLLVPTPDQSRWNVKAFGILCFVRDTTKRSYFIQVFSIPSKTMIFRQEIYSQFDYKMPQPWFMTFEGDNSTVGLNFADHVEAESFKEVLDNKLESKRHRRNDRRSRLLEESPPHLHRQDSSNSASYYQNQNSNNSSSNANVNGGVQNGIHTNSILSHVANVPVKTSINFPASKKNKGKDKDKGKKIGLRKEDIGKPMDFRHVQHVGWDPSSGFALDGVSPDVTAFFNRIGVSSSQLADQNTREFIYNFIENYNPAINKDSISGPIQTSTTNSRRPSPPSIATTPLPNNQITQMQTPPPVPVRHSPQLQHGNAPNKPPAPPPPPVRSFIPPPPSQSNAYNASQQSNQAPPRPAPITNVTVNGNSMGNRTNGPSTAPPPPPPPPSGGGIPPPPPPPMMMDNTTTENSGLVINRSQRSAVVADGGEDRSDLLKQIQQGVSLKKVDPEATQKKGAAGGLSDCLDQIKTGVDLKKTLVTPKIPQTPEDLDGLAGALARALAARSKAINPDSSSDDDDEEDAYDEDEWD